MTKSRCERDLETTKRDLADYRKKASEYKQQRDEAQAEIARMLERGRIYASAGGAGLGVIDQALADIQRERDDLRKAVDTAERYINGLNLRLFQDDQIPQGCTAVCVMIYIGDFRAPSELKPVVWQGISNFYIGTEEQAKAALIPRIIEAVYPGIIPDDFAGGFRYGNLDRMTDSDIIAMFASIEYQRNTGGHDAYLAERDRVYDVLLDKDKITPGTYDAITLRARFNDFVTRTFQHADARRAAANF